jgi:hypothetical protein
VCLSLSNIIFREKFGVVCSDLLKATPPMGPKLFPRSAMFSAQHTVRDIYYQHYASVLPTPSVYIIKSEGRNMKTNETVKMMSIAQVVDFRKTIKPHVNELTFVSLAAAPQVSK